MYKTLCVTNKIVCNNTMLNASLNYLKNPFCRGLPRGQYCDKQFPPGPSFFLVKKKTFFSKTLILSREKNTIFLTIINLLEVLTSFRLGQFSRKI